MPTTAVERLAARWRRTPRVAIPADAARRAVEHDATHAGGGYILPDRLNSPIPDNLHGIVQDESVAVDVLGFTDQEAFNAYIAGVLASVAAASGQYRFPLYTTYAGGDLLFDTDGHLMYVLEDLE